MHGTKRPSNDSRKVVYWRTGSCAFQSHRTWKTWLFSYTSWTFKERQILDSSFACWCTQKPSSTRILRCIKTRPQNARCSPGGSAAIFETTSTTKSAIWKRRKLWLLGRSQVWMAVLQRSPRRNPQAASSSSTSHWPTSLWQTSWSSWQTTSSERWWWFRFPGKRSRK